MTLCACPPDAAFVDPGPTEHCVPESMLDAIDPDAQSVLTLDGCLVALAKGWHDVRNASEHIEVKVAECRMKHLRMIRDLMQESALLARVEALETSNREVRDLFAIAGGSAERDDIPVTPSDTTGGDSTWRG